MILYPEDQISDLAEQRFAFLNVEQDGPTLRIRLARPEKKNAMNPTMMREIAWAMSFAHYRNDVWAVVFSAEGDVFCAGADLKAFAGKPEDPNDSTIPPFEGDVLVGELFNKAHKPCIAEVHAAVFAGAHMITAGCHYVVAVENATFMLPEVKRGIFPMQVMENLLQVLPPRQVLDYCIRSPRLSAEKAMEIGLVSHLAKDVEDMQNQTQTLLDEIYANSPAAIRYGLRAYDELRNVARAEAHTYLRGMLAEVLKTDDAKEGLAAFIEKRPAKWTGN